MILSIMIMMQQNIFLLVTLVCCITVSSTSSSRGVMGDGFGFGFFSRTNGGNVTLPTTIEEASRLGWIRTNRKKNKNSSSNNNNVNGHHAEGDDGYECHDGLGVEFTEGGSTHSKARPLSLFFDEAHGLISGLSVRAWFSSEKNYNPSTWQKPSFGIHVDDLVEGEEERWITITTRDPSKICGAGAAGASTDFYTQLLGDRIIANINSANELHIPTQVPTTHDGAWKFGACQEHMSRHWGYPLDGNASSLLGHDHGIHVFPVVPMYSATEKWFGGVTALAFFTTEAQIVRRNGGVWDATGTAAQLCSGNFCLDSTACEYGSSNSVFHVFFVDQYLSPGAADCGPGGVPDCPAKIDNV